MVSSNRARNVALPEANADVGYHVLTLSQVTPYLLNQTLFFCLGHSLVTSPARSFYLQIPGWKA